MKWLSLLFLASSSLWAKPVVLVGYFDAFGNAKFNNSERVAKGLKASLGEEIDLRLCPMHTVFSKAYGQFEQCLKQLDAPPALALGLGEAGCDMKVEMVARNMDKTKGPDNAGEERNDTIIIDEAHYYLGLRYPLPQMYCALSKKERDDIVISNNAGSFVCNNMAFQSSYYYPDIMFGFIHIPANNCSRLESRTRSAVERLSKMIKGGVKYLDAQYLISPNVPHTSNELRLPVFKLELNTLEKSETDQCLKEFFKRARGVDQKGFLSFLD